MAPEAGTPRSSFSGYNYSTAVQICPNIAASVARMSAAISGFTRPPHRCRAERGGAYGLPMAEPSRASWFETRRRAALLPTFQSRPDFGPHAEEPATGGGV